eukprot:352421-Chlamydomonas_euryale.AAC.38
MGPGICHATALCSCMAQHSSFMLAGQCTCLFRTHAHRPGKRHHETRREELLQRLASLRLCLAISRHVAAYSRAASAE